MAPIPSLLAAVVILLSSSSVSVFAGLPVVDDGSSAGSLAVLPVPQSTNMRRREVPDTFVEGAAAYHIRHARDLPAVDYESASAMKSAGMRVTLPVTLGGAAGMPGGGRVGAREEAEVKMLERRTEGGGAYLPITARGLPAVDFDFAGGTGSAMGKVTLPVAQMSGMAKPAVKPRALEPTIAGGGFLHLPVIHSTNGEHFGDLQLRSPFEEGGPAAHLARRGFQVSLANRSDVAYYAKLAIGNPPQQVYVQLDTGSFELWVNPSCADLTGSDVRFCQAVGRYEVSQSTTARTLPGQGRTLKYGIGSANIEYVVDDVALGDITATSPGVSTTQQLKQIQFGAAVNTTDQFAGILGIGYGLNITVRYKNFVDELADQGLIQKKAFSLALGSKSEQSGSLSFGAYDTSKFAGNLARLPIVPAAQSPDGVPRYWVSMQRMTLTPPSKRVRTYPNSTLPVFLDSGATLTLLPAPLAAAVAADFGSTRLDENGFYPVDCALQDLDGTVDFVFDGITVAVSYREIIRNIPTNPPTCYLGIVPNADFILLGDTFLRSAYGRLNHSPISGCWGLSLQISHAPRFVRSTFDPPSANMVFFQ